MGSNSGYAGKIARVDLSTGAVTQVPTEQYARDFLGGQGLATKIYWDEVPPQVGALDPDNRLIFATGPCAGFPGLAGARWVVCGKSPAADPEFFTHSNLGGTWGAELKAAGFDGLVVHGRAESPVYLLVQDGEIQIKDASGLWGKGAVRVRETLKGELGDSIRVVGTGPAGDNMAVPSTLLADEDSCGTGSLGAVMGSKKLKAIAVRGSGSVSAAHPQRLQELLGRVAELRRDFPSTDTGGGVGSQDYHCSDCTDECNRTVYQAQDGTRGKFMCASGSYYKEWAGKFYDGANEVPFHATRLCDDYGLNTKSVSSMIAWLNLCHRDGLLTEKDTGLPLAQIGSLEFIEALLGSIARREGFGDVLARGLPRAAEEVGSRAQELVADNITRAGENMTYVPKAFITTGLLYAVELRQPIQQLHEVSRLVINWVRWAGGAPGANLSSAVFRAIARKFWGSELAGDFSTYEGKALAAKMIQDRQMVKESLVLCDNTWPMMYVEHSPDHVGDPSLESQVYSAITGNEETEEGLCRTGERVLNLHRAVLAREGYRGREGDGLPDACFTVPLESERLNPQCLFPGKDGESISRKGALLDREKFQGMLGEFYQLRGWDRETGLQRKDHLEGLGLGDVARDLGAQGLLA